MNLATILKSKFSVLASSLSLIQEIDSIASIYEFKKDTVILKENTFVKVIPLVVTGLVKVYKQDQHGNEVLLYYIKPGESCIMSIMAAEKNIAVNIRAVIEDDATVIVIPISNISKLRKEHAKWNAFVYELFNDKFDEVIEMVKILTFSNKQERLEDYLKTKAELNKSSYILKSHQQIANELGSSREVISRLLKKIEKEGKIELSQRQIKLI